MVVVLAQVDRALRTPNSFSMAPRLARSFRAFLWMLSKNVLHICHLLHENGISEAWACLPQQNAPEDTESAITTKWPFSPDFQTPFLFL
jgi:hypothetical protein